MGISWKDFGVGDLGTPDWLKNPGGALFGNRDNTGILGTGQYRTDGSGIDQNAFYDQSAQDGIDRQLAAIIAQRTGRQAPTMSAANIDPTQSNEMRARQVMLANNLMSAMEGKEPSVAEQSLNRAANQNVNNAYGMAASQRGVNPSLALRNAMYTGANINQDAARDGAILRAGEINDARNAFGTLTTNARGQDITLADSQAKLRQDAASKNLDSKIQANAAGDSTALNAVKLRMDNANSNRQAKMDYNTLKSGETVNNNKTDAAAYADAAQGRRDTIGGLGQAFGAAGALMGFFSDEKLKKKATANDPKIQEWLDVLTPYTFNYNNDPEGQAPRAGVMAQDVERSDIGENMVMDTPKGKAINTESATSALLSATAHMNERMNSMEELLTDALKINRKAK